MKRNFVLIVFILLLTPPVLFGDAPALPADVKETLLNAQSVQIVKTVEALPASVRSNFVDENKKGKLGIANPGEPYEVSDAIVDPSLPMAQLIWGARIRELYVVHYMQGGEALLRMFAVYRLDATPKAKALWYGNTYRKEPVETYADFLAAIKHNDIRGMGN